MKKTETFFSLVLLGIPTAAIASDYTGFFAVMYLLMIVSITSAINIGLIIAFYFSGKYSDKKFATKHALIFSVIPIVGCLLSLLDYRTTEDLLFTLGLNLLALVFGLLPILLTRIAEKVERLSPTIVFGISVCCLALSFFSGPIVITAIITAHASLKKATGTLRNYNFVLLAGSYISLLLWLVPTGKMIGEIT